MSIDLETMKTKLREAFRSRASYIDLELAISSVINKITIGLSGKADNTALALKADNTALALKADTGLSNLTAAGEQKIRGVMTQPLAGKSDVLTEYFNQESSVSATAGVTTTGISTTVPPGVFIVMARQVGESPSTLALGIQVDGTFVNSNCASSAESAPNVQAQCVHIVIATAASTAVNSWYSSSVDFTGKRHVLTIYKLS